MSELGFETEAIDFEDIDDEPFETEDDDAESEDFLDDEDVGSELAGERVRRGFRNRFSNRIRRFHSPPGFGGVRSAFLNTPQGNATLRLPASVVTKQEFNQFKAATTKGINSAKSDAAQNRKEIQRQTAALNRHQHLARRRHRWLTKKIKSQSTNSMLMSVLMQQQVQRQLQELHPGTVPASQNQALMLLPLAFSGEGSGDDSMMMMMVMMMMMSQQPAKTS